MIIKQNSLGHEVNIKYVWLFNNKNDEIIHDGTLLEKVGVTDEEIKFSISFDIVIEVDNCSYRANIGFQMPCGNIIEEGTCSLEKTDFSDIVFKRE